MTEADFASRCNSHRGYLLRVAVLQLRDNDLAEDIVQDTLVAALQGAQGFSGRSSLKTWLTGILKHKIVDAIRRKTREPAFASLDEECQIGIGPGWRFASVWSRTGSHKRTGMPDQLRRCASGPTDLMQGCEPSDLADAGWERFLPAVSAYPVAPNLVRGVQALRAADALPAHGDATVSAVDPRQPPRCRQRNRDAVAW